MNVRKLFDVGAPSVMIGQAIGRWGNFINAEAYGTETTLPWRWVFRIFIIRRLFMCILLLYEFSGTLSVLF